MFFTLLKARLSYMMAGLMRQSKRSKTLGVGMIVLFAFLFLYLAGLIAFLSFVSFLALCKPLCDGGNADLYFALAALISFLMGFVGSVFATRTQIFESNDNELLLSMPIPHMAIILSRLASIMVIEYVMQLLIVVPCGIVYIMFYGIRPVCALLFLIGFLLLPFLTLAVTCFVGWIISMITSRLGKFRNLVGVVFYIGFFLAYFYVYSTVFSNVSETGDFISGQLLSIVDRIRLFAPPMVWLGKGINGSILYFLLFALSALVPFAVLLWLMSRTFVKMASAGKRTEHGKYKASDTKVSTVGKALVSRELSRIFSSAGYLINSTAGILMMIVISVLAVTKADVLLDFISLEPWIPRFVPAAVAAVAGFMSSMNTMSASSVSIEGKTLWITKSLPLKSTDVLKAKLLAHVIVCTPITAVSAAVLCVMLKCTAVESILVIVFVTAINTVMAAFGLMINILMPRFDWINETAAAKQSGSVAITMFGGMFITTVVGGVLAVCTFFLGAVPAILIASAIAFAAAALMCVYIFRGGAARFDRLTA